MAVESSLATLNRRQISIRRDKWNDLWEKDKGIQRKQVLQVSVQELMQCDGEE